MDYSSYPIVNRRVVVIGSGYAGVAVVQLCEQYFSNIVVIERRDCMLHKLACPRAAVSPSWANTVMVPQDNTFGPKTKRVRGNVKLLDYQGHKVILDNDEVIPYDYCVIATGTENQSVCEPSMSEGFTNQDLQQHFQKVAKMIRESDRIVIAGGGNVGVEVAGEIRCSYPNKQIVIVGSRDELCPDTIHPAHDFSQRILNTLRKMNVSVILNDRVDFPKEHGSYIRGPVDVDLTRSGKTIMNVDLVLSCVGNKPNTEFVPEGLKDAKGYMKVNDFLQVQGVPHRNVFAMGDCVNIEEPKAITSVGFFHGPGHAGVVCNNIYALATGSGEWAQRYTPSSRTKDVLCIGYGVGLARGAPDFLGIKKSRSFLTPLAYSRNYAQLDDELPGITYAE